MLWDVAPPLTWAILSASALLLLLGFVLLSHTMMRHQAYGDRFDGVMAPGRLESTVRWGTASLLAGLGLWGLELGAPGLLLMALALGAAVALGLESVAVLRHRGRNAEKS